MVVKFQLRKAYNLRIHHLGCLGITKENLRQVLEKHYTGIMIAKEPNKEPKDCGCTHHIHAIVQGEKVNVKKVVQAQWPKAKGNKYIYGPLVEEGILRIMAYIQKVDDKPILQNVSPKQLEQSKKIMYKENKDGQMKAEIKELKEQWLCTKPMGNCGDTRCIAGMHSGCKQAHTRELYNSIGQIYDKYKKDLPIHRAIQICRPCCKRMYPELLKQAARRANNSMWGEY
jgi:hypothetical protein